MAAPAFDADGYPTDETLEAIATWSWVSVAACLDFARTAWHWPDYVREELSEAERELVHAQPEDRFVRFATGGWSGNESIIRALRSNPVVSALTWQLSARGGLHIFRYPREE